MEVSQASGLNIEATEGLHERRLRLTRHEGGALMIMGAMMACFLVGLVYFTAGLSNTILAREQLQNDVDSAALAAASQYARGMNAIALLNSVGAGALALRATLDSFYGPGAPCPQGSTPGTSGATCDDARTQSDAILASVGDSIQTLMTSIPDAATTAARRNGAEIAGTLPPLLVQPIQTGPCTTWLGGLLTPRVVYAGSAGTRSPGFIAPDALGIAVIPPPISPAMCTLLMTMPAGDQTMIVTHFGDEAVPGVTPPYHRGIDIQLPVGTPVVAANTGIVLQAGPLNNIWGEGVIVLHPNGMQTVYAHGDPGSVQVVPNQQVQILDVLMSSGCSGMCNRPHLHFELIDAAGAPMDPEVCLAPGFPGSGGAPSGPSGTAADLQTAVNEACSSPAVYEWPIDPATGPFMGSDAFQIRVAKTRDLFTNQQDSERGVKMAEWETGDDGATFARRAAQVQGLAFAQAEFYFDDNTSADPNESVTLATTPIWKARLRRFSMPVGGGGFSDALITEFGPHSLH